MTDFEWIFLVSEVPHALLDWEMNLLKFNKAFAHCLEHTLETLPNQSFSEFFSVAEWQLITDKIQELKAASPPRTC